MKNIRKKNKEYFTPIAISVCIIAIIFGLVSYFTDYKISNDAYIEGKLLSVNTKVGGLVLHLYAEENQEVKKRDLLMEIDPRLYYENLRKLETDLKDTRNKQALENAQNDISQQQTGIKTIFSKFKFGQNQFNDYHTKYGEDIFPKEEKEEVDPNSLTAPKTEIKKDTKQTITKEKETKEEKLPKPPIDIQKLEAELEQAKLDLSYTKVFAPQDGIISVCSIQEGEYVYIGQSVISIIPKRVWITANFSPKDAEKIDVGQPVIIKIKQYPIRSFKGVVDSVQRTGNNSSQKIPVRITFTEDYSDFNLSPGSQVTVKINVK